MRQRPKSPKPKAKLPIAPKSPKDEDARVRDLEKRLAEALEQQTATSEVLKIISRSALDLTSILKTVAESATRLCGARHGHIFEFDGEVLRFAAGYGTSPELRKYFDAHPVPLGPGSASGLAASERRTIQVSDILAVPGYQFGQAANLEGWRTVLAVPMVKDSALLGTMTIWRTKVQPFTARQIALVETFADQAVIAIENVRLFRELEEKNHALTEAHAEVTEALEQQTATSEILRVISGSPTDTQPVFDAITESAARLCGVADGWIVLTEGDTLRGVSAVGQLVGQLPVYNARHIPLTRESVIGRAILDRTTIQIDDLAAASEVEYPEGRALQRMLGHRTQLVTPLLREGVAIGAILLARFEVRLFSERQIELLKTFADQAVIAIENVRLFTELQQKNRALTESLDQQTATSEILQTIAQAQTDVQPVFDTIVRSAARLCHAAMASVSLSDGRRLYLPANYGSSLEAMAAVRARFPRPLDKETVTGAAILTRSVVQVPDVDEPSVPEFTRQAGQVLGYRSVLTVPMLRQSESVGAINVTRREPGRFSDAEVELLKTFADQAVIAIENVRLFTELEGANRELSAASQHKSEFLANMSHELRTPLNAIIGFSEVLTDRMFGDLNEKQEEYLKDIYSSGTHLLSLINDILDLSKIEAGRMELELTDFHLPTALDNALALIRERAGRRSITLQTSIDEQLGEVRADERKIRQVVLNLLSNAIKFTPEGGRIEVAAAPKDGFVEVSVNDTGVGIAPEDQEAVFEEFRQVGTADKKAEGTGLGLTLCRKFIELHGGRIWVTSQVGVGSTFTFTIPVRRGE